MKTATMGRFYRVLGCFAAGAYLRTKHDAYKVRRLMAAVV